MTIRMRKISITTIMMISTVMKMQKIITTSMQNKGKDKGGDFYGKKRIQQTGIVRYGESL